MQKFHFYILVALFCLVLSRLTFGLSHWLWLVGVVISFGLAIVWSFKHS